VFVGFSRIFLLGIWIFKGLTARRLYKSFGFKGLNFFFGRSALFENVLCLTVRWVSSCTTINKHYCEIFVLLWRTTIEKSRCQLSPLFFYSTLCWSEDGLWCGKITFTFFLHVIVWYENVTFGGCVSEQGLRCARACCLEMSNISVHVRQRNNNTACGETPCLLCKHGRIPYGVVRGLCECHSDRAYSQKQR
jgi:hypothetical protein